MSREPTRPPSSTLFIGNIPYDVTEQMLHDVFSEAGPVKSVRLVMDRETGKPKGFGFVQFFNMQTAESAIRNLRNQEFSGRTLRLDYAEDTDVVEKRMRRDPVRVTPLTGPPNVPVGPLPANNAAEAMAAMLGGRGGGQDSINSALAGMSRTQLYDIMGQMKGLIQQNRQAARNILINNPQLTKTLLQAQIMLGMVKPTAQPATSSAPATTPAGHVAPPVPPPSVPTGGPHGAATQYAMPGVGMMGPVPPGVAGAMAPGAMGHMGAMAGQMAGFGGGAMFGGMMGMAQPFAAPGMMGGYGMTPQQQFPGQPQMGMQGGQGMMMGGPTSMPMHVGGGMLGADGMMGAALGAQQLPAQQAAGQLHMAGMQVPLQQPPPPRPPIAPPPQQPPPVQQQLPPQQQPLPQQPPPPQVQPQVQPQQPQPQLNPDQQQALIQQIISMPLEQIEALPEHQKAQVLALRRQFGAQT